MRCFDPWLALGILVAAPVLAVAQQGRFAAADADRDGMLSRGEVQRGLPRLAPRFAALDRNGDGYLSPEELRARAGTGKHRSDATEGGFAQHFRRADADGDGALTRAEAERALSRLVVKFDRIDADGDARLTPDELRRYFDARRTARGKSGESAPR
jgi:Ca2+-binding EF-hand superfamily protein